MSYAPISLGRVVRSAVSRSFAFTETAHGAGTVLDTHAHENAAISYVIDGSRTYRFGSRMLDAVRGAIVFVPGGAQHATRFDRSAGRGLMVELLHPGKSTAGEPVRRLGIEIAHACDAILREMRRPDTFTPLALESLALDLTAIEYGPEPSAAVWLKRVRDALHDSRHDAVSLDALAADAGVGRSRLTRAFRRAYGMSIGAYARGVRAQRAWQLVACSEDSLPDVAALCGFADQSHLTRAFRRAFGMSPGQLRQHESPRAFKTRSGRRG